MRRWIALCVVGALGFGAGCSRKSSDTAARLTVAGQSEVSTASSAWSPFSGERGLGPGDRVKISNGTAVISLSDDRRLELREGSEVTLSLGRGGRLRPELSAGDLLAVTQDEEIRLSTDEVDVEVKGGAARLTRDQGVVVASYSASVLLDSAGETTALTPLRRMAVPLAGFLQGPSPLRYSPDDPWDQRYLGEALQLRDQLVARSQGFTAQLSPGEGQNAGFFRQILPSLADEPDLDVLLGPPRPAGERLVGLAIALTGNGGSLDERWREVLAFRDLGADWGLVAVDQGASRIRLLTVIDAAIGLGPSLLASAPAPAAPAPGAPSPSVSAPSAGSPSSSAPSAPAAPPSGQGQQGQPVPRTANTGPLRTGIEPVDSTVNSLVELLGGLLNTARK